MLKITDATMAAFEAKGLAKLRHHVLAHWFEALNQTGEQAGPTERERILAELEQMARDDGDLTYADLTALGDLMLVDAANRARQAQR